MVEIAVQASSDFWNSSMGTCSCGLQYNYMQNNEFSKIGAISLLRRIERLERHCYGLKQFINEPDSRETVKSSNIASVSDDAAAQDTTTENLWETFEVEMQIPEVQNVTVIKDESLKELSQEASESNHSTQRSRDENDMGTPIAKDGPRLIAKRLCIEGGDDFVEADSRNANGTGSNDGTNTTDALTKMQGSLEKVTNLLMTGLAKIDQRFIAYEQKVEKMIAIDQNPDKNNGPEDGVSERKVISESLSWMPESDDLNDTEESFSESCHDAPTEDLSNCISEYTPKHPEKSLIVEGNAIQGWTSSDTNLISEVRMDINGSEKRISDNEVAGVLRGVLPSEFPISSTEQLREWQKLLTNVKLQDGMSKAICSIGGDTVDKFIRRTMKHVMNNQVALKCSITGRSGKIALRCTPLFYVIVGAVKLNSLTSACSQLDIEESLRKWLIGARDRYGNGRKRRKVAGSTT